MLWIVLSLACAALYSITAFIDNYIADVIFRGNKTESTKGIYGPSYIAIGIILAIIFGLQGISLKLIGIVAASSIFISLASIPYYKALKNEDATGATVYYQLSPLIYLATDLLILGRTISTMQLIGFVVILLAPIFVIFARKNKKSQKLAAGSGVLLLLYVIISTTGGSLYVIANEYSGAIMTTFILAQIFRGLSDTALFLTNKSWKARVKNVCRNKKKQLLAITLVNQLIFVAAEYIYRYAFTIENASSVSVVVNASELIITFALGIVLSIIWPNFGREKIHKREVLAHLTAVVLATIGIIIIN